MEFLGSVWTAGSVILDIWKKSFQLVYTLITCRQYYYGIFWWRITAFWSSFQLIYTLITCRQCYYGIFWWCITAFRSLKLCHGLTHNQFPKQIADKHGMKFICSHIYNQAANMSSQESCCLSFQGGRRWIPLKLLVESSLGQPREVFCLANFVKQDAHTVYCCSCMCS